MQLPRSIRDGLAGCLRSLPIKGRWRLAAPLNRLFPPEEVTINLAGVGRVTLDLSIRMLQEVYWSGLHKEDAAIQRLARTLLPRDGVFVDVGANIGLHTLAIAAHVAEGGSVVAFEPHPLNHRLLVRNLRQNNLRHVVAENAGLAEFDTTLIGSAQPGGGNWSLASRGDHHFDVRLMRLDDYWRDHPLPRLDLMKIDVEGAEVRVLRGARQTIARFRPLIVFEVCPPWLAKMQTNVAELMAELMSHDYRIHPLPLRQIVWDHSVTLAELSKLGPDSFINLVAVPRPSARPRPHSSLPAEVQAK